MRAAGFEPASFLASAPTPPAAAVVSQAEEDLLEMGAFKPRVDGVADDLTALGKHLDARA